MVNSFGGWRRSGGDKAEEEGEGEGGDRREEENCITNREYQQMDIAKQWAPFKANSAPSGITKDSLSLLHAWRKVKM